LLGRARRNTVLQNLPRYGPARPGAGEAIESPQASSDPAAHVDDLYERYARALLGYLRHRLPSLADAEDVLAEVFLAALRSSNLGETPGVGWLMIVTHRRIADFYRERIPS
jgi:DNA-directed RNA polymerase specialized sigma24 family protein